MAQDNTNFDPLAPLGPSVGKFNMDVTNPLNLDPFGFKKLDIEQVKLVDVIPNYGALTSPQRNIRENLVGSPPNRPGPKKDSSFEKSAQAADSYMRSIFQTNQDKNEYSRIYGYNAGEDGNNYYKRYAAYGSKKMAEVGFSPFRDNEALYNSRTTKWNDFTRMVNHSLLPGVWLGIKSNVEGTFDMLRGDFTSINLDNAAEYEKISNIGMSTKGGAFGFVNNALSSFGLSAGIIIETIAEQAATKAIEAGLVATGAGIPAAGALEVAADVSAAAKFGRVGKLFSNLDRSFGAAVKTLESSQAARSFWKVANTPVGKFINPLGNTLDAMNDIRKAQSFGNLTSLAKISKTAGGFYRDMKFINAAVTEGKLEGGMQQNKVYYDLYNLHYKDNGKAPSDKQMYDMMVQSERAGQENLAWNTGVIYLSNKLVFPNIAGGKGTASLLRAKTQEIVNLEKGKILFKTVKEEGKKVLKGEFTYVKNGIRGTLKGLREQGFKESVKSLSAKSVVVLGKYFKGNIAEGLQENFQETISEALGNYYVNTFNSDAVKAHLYSKGAFADASRSKASYFKDAWANQNPFTKQGFETFATGFIMGAFAYPINNLPSWASTGYNKMFRPEEYADYKLKRNTFGEGIAQTLTDLYNDNPAEFFNSKLFNLGNQEILTKIIQEGGRKNTLDAKDFALVSQVTTALRSGTLDLFKERVESFRDLTPEEFEDAVGNIPKGEGLKYQSRIDDIVKRMDEIKTNYEKINDKYVNPIDLSQYEKGTDAYKKAQLFSQAWEVAKMNAVFMGSSYQDAVKRMKDISTKIKSSKPLSKMTDSEIQLLLEPSRMSNERDILKEEIEAQKNVLSPEELRKKQNKLKALEALSEAYKNYDKFQNNQVTEIVEKFKESGELEKIAEENNMSIDEAEAELRKEINRTNRVGENTNENRLELESNLEKAYKDYLKAIASSTGDIYLSEEADEAFEMILDSYKLGKEASILANYVNVLNNPRDFMNHVQRNYQWMNNLYNNRRDYFSNIVNQQLDNIELNALLNELADRNVYISEDEAAEFLRSSTIPTEFYDDTRKVVIKEGHPEYDQYAIFFERASAVRKLNPKGRSADNTALNYTLARLNAEKEAALNALPKTEERVEKGNIDIPKGTKATIDDIDRKLSVGQYVSLKYRSGLRVKELILYKSNEGLRYNSPAGDIVNKVTVTQGFEAAKKYTLELVADQAAIDKINAEFTQKKIDAIQELTARAQSEKLTQASTYIPFTKNTKFELMDEALKKQLENAFNQYVEDTEGLADKLSEVSDEKLLSALDDFIQNNPRAEKVIEQYNAKMKEKLAAQQLDEVEPPVMQVRGKDQDFKDLDIKDIKANIKKIETDIKKLQGKTDLTDQEKENLAILEFNLALANKFLNYKLNFKESAKRSKVIKEVSKVIDQQGDITFDETTNQYTVNGNKLEKVNKEIERVISEKYQEKQRDQIAQIYNNTLAKNNSVDGFISELKKANLPGFTEDTYNELSEKLKALTGETAQSSLEPTTTPVSDIEAKKDDIERRRQEELKNPIKTTEGRKETAAYSGEKYTIQVFIGAFKTKYSVEVAQKDNTVATGYISKESLSKNSFDTYEEALEYANKIAKKDKENLNKINAKYDAELDALEGKPTTAPKVKPEDLKINVTATAKKGGMELAQEQDSTIEKIDEGKFIRLTKADANDINGKYYTIDNGVLRVRVNGRDFAGRPGGATQLSVKVPDTFNEQIFADKLKNISHKGEVTTPEAIDQVVNDLRNAISESTGRTTTQVSTGDNIAQIENELKEVERQINNQTTQPTSDKTYQDLFNEKWPDASGYLTASPTKSEFNKEESKFIEGKHIFEIRPIGNNEFEYRVVNNRVSQNRASTNYDKFIQPTAQELNGPDGADTIVTVKPGILRKEGDKFIVEKEVQVFYANSSTINNKVGTTTAAPVKVDITELEARRAELLEKLKTAKFAPPAASTSQVSTEAPRTGFRTFNVPISKKEDIADVVAGALVPASEIFWDKNIQTTGSWLNSVQGETVGGQDYIEIAIDSLSEENRKIADELKESDTDFGGIKGVRIVLGINLTPEQAQKKSIEIANKFKQQDLLWYEPTTLQDKIDGLEKQKQRSSTPKTYDQEIQRVKDTWGTELKQGEYFDEATKTIWASKELYDKSKSLKTEPVTRRRISLDDVLSLVNERAFEQKAETETYITDQIKNFLADKEVKNDPTLLSQQAFDSLFGSKSILAELKEKANLGDIVIIPAKLTVFDIPAGVAGEINFLLVDREGNTTIVLVKMGDVNKWEEYDDETSDVSKKESYGLELVAAKNMLYNMTGINPKIVLLPLQISTDSATGRIETIESASPILVPGKIVAPVDPNQTTADGETLQIKINDIIPMRTAAGEPVIEEVVDEEQATIEQEVEDIAAQQRRLAKENKIAILDKIQTLRSRQQKLDTDLKKVNDILNYLDTIGNASIELTADELTDIINSITALDQVTGQYLKSKFRKGRGKTSIKNQDVRDQFRREFVVIAGVVGRLEDLRKEKEILTAQVNDLNDQIDYYQNILDTEDLALFSRSDIKIKIAAIKKKINSLNRSIKTINDTILRTKKLLKEYIDGIKKLDSQVGQQLQLIPDANYKPLSKEEVERLEKAVDNLENATLEDFNSIVKQFKNLRSRLSATMDVAELTPKVKELEIERINSLQESLKSYGKEVRYLNDILNMVSEESLTNKLSDKNSNGPKPTNTKNTSSTNQNKLDETVDKSKGEVISEISLGEILSLAERPVKESVISEKAADIIARINSSTVDEIKEMLKDVSDLTAYEVKVINDAAKSRIKSLTEEFKSEIKDQMNDIQETQYVTVQPIDDIPAGSLITITNIEGDNITFEVANSNEKKSVKFDNLNGKIMTQEEAKSKAAVETIEITPEAKSKIIESITAADSLTNADIDNIIDEVKDKDLDTLEEELYNKKIC
jgi:hypothetical protein